MIKTRELVLAGAAAVGGVLLFKALTKPKAVSLKNKVVLVTGASAGIGRATAYAFAAEGAHVILAARRAERLRELADELQRYEVSTLVVPTDITKDDDLETLVSEAVRTFGRIDVLINNAAFAKGGALVDMDAAELHNMLQTNLHGTFRLTQLVLPVMLEQGSGHIVNLSSAVGEVSLPGVSVYSATKAAILCFSKCMRRELCRQGICVSTVIPAGVKTDMIASLLNEYFDPEAEDNSPLLAPLMRVIDEPETIAREIVDVVRYRKRSIEFGGPSMAAAVGLDTLAPGALDGLVSMVDTESITKVTAKLGA